MARPHEKGHGSIPTSEDPASTSFAELVATEDDAQSGIAPEFASESFNFSIIRTDKPSSVIFERWLRVLALEGSVFRSIVLDRSAIWQALFSILAVGFATALGVVDDSGWSIVAPTMISSLVGLFVWAFLIYVIVSKTPDRILPNQFDPELGGVIRIVAFAQLPGLFRAIGFFTSIGPMTAVLSFFWIIIAMTIAVNQAFQMNSIFRSLIVVLITFVPYLALVGLFTLVTVS